MTEYRDKRTAHMLALYGGGMTLREVGNIYGLTRERVRQIFRHDPVASGEYDQLQTQHQERRQQEMHQRQLESLVKQQRVCRVCGRGFFGQYKACSEECTRVWKRLDYIVDDDRYRTMRANTAKWQIKAGRDTNHHKDFLAGKSKTRGRWLQPTSKTFFVAIEARRRRWPICDLFPKEILQQIDDHVAETDGLAGFRIDDYLHDKPIDMEEFWEMTDEMTGES